MMAKKIMRTSLKRLRRWLTEDAEQESGQVPFDNSYEWLGATFLRLMRDPECGKRPAYLWGGLQAAALAKVLGFPRISFMEFGVAGGSGLLALERIAQCLEETVGLGIEVYGFDTGSGLSKPIDYRDSPNMFEGGYYPMNKELLQSRLRRAHLTLGSVDETVPSFINTQYAPVGFISIDLVLYSSTLHALGILDAPLGRVLPRVYCYFDDIMGYTIGDYNGERLAISEFNAGRSMRKLSPIYGLKYHVPWQHVHSMWVELFYIAHIFNHPLYGERDRLSRTTVLDIHGNRTGESTIPAAVQRAMPPATP